MVWLFIFFIVTVLILINAFYVAAEFATVSSRRARVVQMAGEGNRTAQALLPIVEDPRRLDTYIATCQLGITLSSLLLGFYGQGSVAENLIPIFIENGWMSEVAARSLIATATLLFLTVLQALLGELVPKNIGIQYPEQLAMATVIPMRWSMAVFKPLIWFFNGSGQLVMHLLGITPMEEGAHIHAPEEIIMLVEESSAGGLLDKEERRLLENTLQLRGSMVREVMIPRTRMFAAPVDGASEEMLALVADSPFSRLPLYSGSIDNIVGVIHLKDLLCLSQQEGYPPVREVMRPVLFVPETMRVRKVFGVLQRKSYHLAVVLDEFGGTAGMVTLEDLIEEIFGDLQDEFDDIAPAVRILPGNRLVVRGDTLVKELNEWLDIYLSSQDVDTVGGLLLNKMGRVPKVGDELNVAGMNMRVEAMDGKGISMVGLEVTSQQLKRLKDLMA